MSSIARRIAELEKNAAADAPVSILAMRGADGVTRLKPGGEPLDMSTLPPGSFVTVLVRGPEAKRTAPGGGIA